MRAVPLQDFDSIRVLNRPKSDPVHRQRLTLGKRFRWATGRTFETALLEVFGDQWVTLRITARDFLKEFDICEIRLERRLKVVNLSGKQLNRLGADANIFASFAYDVTQKWASFFMDHPDAPHGIRYPSRKNQRLHNFALFSTPEAIAAVTITRRYPLLNHPHLFRLLQSYKVALV